MAMDPEEQRELEEQFLQLNNTIASLSGTLSGLAQPMSSTKTALDKNSNGQKNLTQNIVSNTSAKTKIQEAQEKTKNSTDALRQSMDSALSNLGSSVGSLGSSLISSEQGFKKYGTALDLAGKATIEAAFEFGPVGIALGALLFGIGKVVKAGLEQADNLLKGVDALSNMGAAGQITSDKMYNMAHQMGLTTKNLEVFTKAVDRNRTSMIALGQTAGEGQMALAKMLSVTPEQRQAFQRLGVSQEELMGRMSDYVDLQVQTGNVITENDIKSGKAQRDMLQYAQTVSVVSQITGKNADEAKKGMMQAKAANNITIHTARLNAKMHDPKTSEAEKKQIEKQLLIEDQLLQAAQQTGNKQAIAAMQSYLATGVITQESAVLTKLGIDPKKIVDDQKKRSLEDIKAEKGAGEARAQFLDSFRSGIKKTINEQGTAMAYNTKFGESMGVDTDSIKFVTDNATTDFRDQNRLALQAIGDAANGKTNEKTDQDPEQLARNKLTQTEIDAGQAADDVVKSMNPLLGNTGKFALFAVAAGAATAGLLAILVKGRLSTATELAGGAGGAAVGAAESGAAALLPNLRKADLLDKNGNVLGGAALSSRLKKLAGKEAAQVGSATATPKQGFGESLKSVADALSKAGAKAPMIVLGAGALAAAVVEIGGAFALVTGMMSVAIKAFGEGLQSFSKVDGKNLAQVGIGMTGLTAGVVAMAAAAPALLVINSLTKVVSGKGIIDNVADMLIALQKKDFDRKKLENNGAALMGYAKAMAALSALGAASGIADAIKGVFGAIIKIPTAQPPFKELENFSKLTVDPAKTKTNADAFVLYSQAMSAYKGGPGLLTAVSQIAGAKLVQLFGQDGPLDSFAKFAAMPIGPKAAENAKAFFNFASAMGILSGANSGLLGNLVKGAVAGAVVGAAKVVSKTFSVVGGSVAAAATATGNAATGAISTVGDWLMNLIGKHEGIRNKPYKDSKGLWTVGIGHLIGDGKTLPPEWNKTFSDAEVKALFKQDYDHHARAAANIPGYDKVNEKGKGALVDLTFNMGPSWYKKWPNFTKALGAGDTEGAVAQLQGSLWAKQVGNRANDDIGLLRGSSLKAAKGGLFTGSTKGYPMELHGTELVIPVTPNSVLMKLSSSPESMIADMEKTSKASVSTVSKKITTTATSTGKRTPGINHAMITSLARRFDQVITTIEKSDRVNKKIIKHS
jgi:lysozyme